MGKKELKSYLRSLKKGHLEEQLLDLYERFKDVKVYYDFIFDPKEDKLLEEAKIKISREYFPVGRRKAKARRSVAQKYIKHFMTLGAEPSMIADVMLFNIEIALAFAAQKPYMAESFYKSMLNSYKQSIHFLKENSLISDYKKRVDHIISEINNQNWPNKLSFISSN